MTARACVVLACFLAVNGALAYSNRRTAENAVEKNATKVAAALADKDALIITTNNYNDFRGYSLDSHMRRPTQMVVMNDMLLNTVNTGGVYKPWTPYVQTPNVMNNPTIDTDTLVFDITTADYVEFAPGVQTTQYGDYYTVATIVPDEPFLKTAIAGMDGYSLLANKPATFLVFDKALLARGEITLTLVMRSTESETATVTFTNSIQTKTLNISNVWKQYELTLSIGDVQAFNLSADRPISIDHYETK